jgi:hypothetical protein
VDDLDGEPRRIAQRHPLAAARVLALLDGARPLDRGQAQELGARGDDEARADEPRARTAVHAVAERRRRRRAQVERVGRPPRDPQAEVGEEVLRALEVGALEDEVRQRRGPGRRRRVPGRVRRGQLVHRGARFPLRRIDRHRVSVQRRHMCQVDEYV